MVSKKAKENKKKPQELEKKIKKLEELLEEKEKELEEKKDQIKRSLADYQNQAKRFDKMRTDLTQRAGEEILTQILPLIADLKRASASIKDDGFSLIVKKMDEVLEKIGVYQLGEEGEEFDPEVHDCLDLGEGEENKVIEILEKGYIYKDKVISPAKVRVGKKLN